MVSVVHGTSEQGRSSRVQIELQYGPIGVSIRLQFDPDQTEPISSSIPSLGSDQSQLKSHSGAAQTEF